MSNFNNHMWPILKKYVRENKKKVMINREYKYIYKTLEKNTRGTLKICRIENSLGEGFPDLIVQNREGETFLIELKYFESWPKRETTIPFRKSFEKGQLPFLVSWKEWKGTSFVLIKVEDENEFYLFEPSSELSKLTKNELIDNWLIAVGIEKIIGLLES